MTIQQLPGRFGESSLLAAPPVLAHPGETSETIMATLGPAGQVFAFTHGRKALTARLHEECIEVADIHGAASIPWHFLDPARAADDSTRPGARPTLPSVIGRGERDMQQVIFACVPANLAWFDGHFPDDPILPAVVQIDWVIHFGADCGLTRGDFAGMNRLKFHSVIVPDTVLRLTLGISDDSLRFVYESRDGLHSQGKIRFHAGADQG